MQGQSSCGSLAARQNSESKDERGKEALQEIREMHRAWKKKLELEAIEGELSDAG